MMHFFPRHPLSVKILAVSLLVSGCASDQSKPAVEIRTVTQTVEVQRPCPATIPTRPAKLARPLPTDATALAAVLAERLYEWDAPGGFGDKAISALSTCTKATP